MEAERKALAGAPLRQLAVLVRYWTRREPSEDFRVFVAQAAEALWVEERVTGSGRR
jgi:hypothetical protein